MISFIFTLLCVPETKGLTITQIDELYEAQYVFLSIFPRLHVLSLLCLPFSRIPAWRSASWISTDKNEIQVSTNKPVSIHTDNVRFPDEAEKKHNDEIIPDSGVATPATPRARSINETA
jgi:hypothetical protein